MSAIDLGVAGDRNVPLLRWVVGIVWLVAAAVLWLSLGSYYDSVVLFRERINPGPQDLETVTFKILKCHNAHRTSRSNLSMGRRPIFRSPIV
jgi:hypothetical protein